MAVLQELIEERFKLKNGDKWTVWADGSVHDNGKPTAVGGYGYVVFKNGKVHHLGGGWTPPPSTNNTSEMMGVLVPMVQLNKKYGLNGELEFVSDSKYVVNMSNLWVENKLRSGEEFPNRELWTRFQNAARMYGGVNGVHVRGHQEHKITPNLLVDWLAGYCLKERRIITDLPADDEFYGRWCKLQSSKRYVARNFFLKEYLNRDVVEEAENV